MYVETRISNEPRLNMWRVGSENVLLVHIQKQVPLQHYTFHNTLNNGMFNSKHKLCNCDAKHEDLMQMVKIWHCLISESFLWQTSRLTTGHIHDSGKTVTIVLNINQNVGKIVPRFLFVFFAINVTWPLGSYQKICNPDKNVMCLVGI